jgi:hypothetical protein
MTGVSAFLHHLKSRLTVVLRELKCLKIRIKVIIKMVVYRMPYSS